MFFLIRKHNDSSKLCIKEVRPGVAETFRKKNKKSIMDEDPSDIEALRESGEILQFLFFGEFNGLIELDLLEE